MVVTVDVMVKYCLTALLTPFLDVYVVVYVLLLTSRTVTPVGVLKLCWSLAPEVDLTTDSLRSVGETAPWKGFLVR